MNEETKELIAELTAALRVARANYVQRKCLLDNCVSCQGIVEFQKLIDGLLERSFMLFQKRPAPFPGS